MSIDHKTRTQRLTPRYLAEGLLIYTLFGILKLLGLRASSAFGGWLGRTIGPRIGRNKTARNNIKLAFPDITEAKTDALLLEMWDNLGRTICEYPHLNTFRADMTSGAHKLVIVENMQHLSSLISEDKPTLFFSGHFANWEVTPIALAPWYARVGEVVRPANNPIVNRVIYNLRQNNVAPHQVPKGRSGTRALMKLIKNNGLVALLLDQKDNAGIQATLFGHEANTPIGGAGLALRFDCDLIPVSVRREGRSPRFVITVGEPLPRFSADDPESTAKLVQLCNDEIEAMIRKNPGQWMWLHNRFRKPTR